MAWLLRVGGLLPQCGKRETGYVAWSAPLGEEEGKRAQAQAGVAGRVDVWTLSDHRFQKHSDSE